MSNNGEDIIRETFEKFGDAIGVQMQIPDAMIANLGAVLQAQIDLLAELQSAGRLVPTGGMALTAEDVRKFIIAIERHYPEGEAELLARLRALFPVTEPAEPAASEGVNCGANSVVLGWCTLSAQHEGLHTNGTYFWGQAPAPAEPAGEETKAEVDGDFIEIVFDGPPEAVSGRFVEVENPQGASISVGEWIDRGDGFWALRIPYPSSPVVPAPTETGPWQRIEDVPEGVLQIKDRHGRTWLVVGGTWRFEWHDGNWYEPHTNINAQAPFVAAAKEG